MFDIADPFAPRTAPAVTGALSAPDLGEWASALVIRAREDADGLRDAERVAVISALEEIKSAAAAAQAHLTAAFESSQRAAQEAAGLPSSKRGAGVAAQVGLARRESPHRGAQHLGIACALVNEMPCTLRALEQGLLSEWRATLLVRESACLSLEDRLEMDAELAADSGRLEGWGDVKITAEARRIAYRLDPHAVVRRASRAEGDRHVSIRPAPDTMVRLSALLPVAKGVAVYATLKAAAETARATGDPRGKGQLMADALIERLTGLSQHEPSPVTVNVVMTDRALLKGDTEPAFLPGYGTVPAASARDLIQTAAAWKPTDDTGPDSGTGRDSANLPRSDNRNRARVRAFLRRVFTAPGTGELVAMDSRARRFPSGLGAFIELRDQTCRTPWCDAPIAHRDHPWAWAAGGPTTAGNSQGLCEACNYAKQAPGWRARTVPGPRHTVETTTPTGHRYRSTAPPLPGAPPGADLIACDLEENLPPAG